MNTARISNLRATVFPSGLIGEEYDYAIVESPSESEFIDLKKSALLPERYTRGKAFGRDSELHWLKRSGGDFHLVYVSDLGRQLPGALPSTELELLPDEEPDRFLLWGEFHASRDEYLEGRIPGVLRYPKSFPNVAEGGRAAIRLRHYRFSAGAERRRVTRCVEIIPMEAPINE